MSDGRNFGFDEEITLLEAKHRYNNFSSILKEMRFLDKVIITFSGAIWAFIIIKLKHDEYVDFLYFIPFFISLILASKAFFLNSEYKEQKCKYDNIINNDKKDCNKKDFYIHSAMPFTINILVVFANFIAGIYMIKCD